MPESVMQQTKLVVGLGNPGAEYANTRHNAGFAVIEKLLAALPAGRFAESHTAESRVFSGRFRSRTLTLQMPLTFMNLSGKAVAPLARRLGILPEEILVVSDDLDLPLGKLRLRCGGSDGGHNGLKSIIEELGSGTFLRVRVGIGRPEPGKTVDYVLGSFDENEAKIFGAALTGAAEAVKMVLTSGISRAMNHFNAWNAAEVENKEENSH